MKLGLLIVSLMALSLVSCAELEPYSQPEPDWPTGIYGNVILSARSGDLGGFEVRFFEEDRVRMAEFTFCEGWCNQAYRSEVIKDGESFRISHIEELTSNRGATFRSVEFLLTPNGEQLTLRMWYDGMEVELYDRTLLAIEAPFGLDVANSYGN